MIELIHVAALITKCYTQHALHPYNDSEINYIRHLSKIQLINERIKFLILPSIFKDKTVIFSIPTFFENKKSPIIFYKYNKLIHSIIHDFYILVNELILKL